ncbi:unnamed protein product [Spirodela intermedia]|uniref:Uncharacterized protein n=1 Tax=Spirodela intermedia TaxID=51605 RepID=A0A7I8KBE2_SPIIN|nr:unnamed protein product [Spirodela intermedia]
MGTRERGREREGERERRGERERGREGERDVSYILMSSSIFLTFHLLISSYLDFNCHF